jgi:hypothetical protein
MMFDDDNNSDDDSDDGDYVWNIPNPQLFTS